MPAREKGAANYFEYYNRDISPDVPLLTVSSDTLMIPPSGSEIMIEGQPYLAGGARIYYEVLTNGKLRQKVTIHVTPVD